MTTLAYKAAEAIARPFGYQRPFRLPHDEAFGQVAKINAQNAAPPRPLYWRFDVEERTIAGTSTYIFCSKNLEPQRRILFLHGGGGMLRATPLHFVFVWHLVTQTRAEVWMPFYPLAPEHNVLESLDACFSVYQQMLVRTEADGLPLAIAGDSAGANLTLGTCRKAIDAGVRVPHALVALSPATGFEDPNVLANFKAQELATNDPILCTEMMGLLLQTWCGNVPLDHPLANPAFIDYTGFPPILMLYSTAELFYPYTENIPAAMRAANAPLEELRMDGLMHDWMLVNFFPEGAAANVAVWNFIRNHT
ncbi:MAG: alpha/beta hydrolase fold domain-containing protein [Eggerthellaceae bacterium]|nr:alpha/beta hydrolase fold domain-containing protein [Eggerthellaceae bacterium]